MPNPLEAKHVVLGVTGSIACYKAVDLASKLTQQGALVDVVMTDSALEFVTELAFQSITHRPVVVDLFEPQSESGIDHIDLAERADVIVIGPATANTIAKVAIGMADDALTTTVLATRAPLIVCPAMDGYMYDNPATQENLAKLKGRGVTMVGPVEGHLASDLSGRGRMLEPQEIVGHICQVLGREGDLAGRTIVVSAGGTWEPIDPVRVITNRSSGKQGFAVAEAARDRGANVRLVTGPSALSNPPGVEVTRVETVTEMRDAVLGACEDADALIMAAAVSDYRPAEVSSQKIKKENSSDGLALSLETNPDFMSAVPKGVVKVGFAAETEDVEANAKAKLSAKALDLIAANDVTVDGSGFASDTNRVVLLDKNGDKEQLGLMSKYDVGHKILDRVAGLLTK